jgi:predicted choloylglycine hydrolase
MTITYGRILNMLSNFLKKIQVIGIIFLLILVIDVSSIKGDNDNSIDVILDVSTSSQLNGGWVEERDGVTIIHLNGSHYQMGFQLGTLLKKDYLSSRRAWLSILPLTYDEMVDLWYNVSDLIPQQYKDEIQGRADALDLTFEETAIMDVIGIAFHGNLNCCGLAAWGPSTEDYKLYHFRSCDGLLDIIDPVTGKYASDDQLLIVRNPDEGYSSVVIGLSIEVGAEGGFNEHGIGIGYSSVKTSDVTSNGIPCGIRKRMLLEQASTLDQAVDIYSSSSTMGWNQIISDAKIPKAVVIEQSANYNRVCNWNDSFENNYPSWIMDHIIRRGNFFLDPVSAGFEEDIYEKSRFIRYILYCMGFDTEYYYFSRIMHYKVMSKAIEDKWGELNLSNIMNTFRDVYQGKTNPFYRFMQMTIGEYQKTWHQWVACPETGEIAVSFSNKGKTAFKNPVAFFNIYELLEE